MSLSSLILPFKDLLSSDAQASLVNYVKSINFNDNLSFVYDKINKENTINPEVRKSKTFISKDVSLLGFVNTKVIGRMNEQAKGDLPMSKYTFSLARDYITFIRYDKGDFFDWHVDFEKVRINKGENGFKEMHFLYCVQAPVSGGQLLIRKGGKTEPLLSSEILAIQEACTENSAVVFDKLMEHSGAEVKEGTKIIMTVDVNVVSEVRMQSGISLQLENDISHLISGTRQWVSFRGDFPKFKQFWKTIYNNYPKNFVPFIQIKAQIGEDSYEVHATCEGIIAAYIVRENHSWKDGKAEYQYLVGDWYYHKVAGDYSPDSKIITMVKESNDDDNGDEYEEDDNDNDDDDEDDDEDMTENILTELRKERKVIGKSFATCKGDPITFINDLIEGLVIDDREHGRLQKIPHIEWLELDKTVPRVHELPDSIYDDDEWCSVEGGFSYYCNEDNYDEFTINYRYGIINTLTL